MIPAPGFGCDQYLWRLAVPLPENDFTVAPFDQVGAGRSDLPGVERGARCAAGRGYTQDVLELCRQLDLGPATFVGHAVNAMTGALRRDPGSRRPSPA
ncbi:alpha/beta hydrolase [Streptomyces sp. NPDC046925]|uniref:alpha/beta fold hydrolase n=1 Tax=Streptomyces sp. NPDC046925 TaxID=3155375 RepID=UPI0033C433AA